MKFVGETPDRNEGKLIEQMWEILRGDELGGVSVRNILFFLIGINKLQIKDVLADHDSPSKSRVITASCLLTIL